MLAGQATDPEETLPQGTGKTRDKVAAATGIGSGRTYDKAAQVWEAAKAGHRIAPAAQKRGF